jgi:hypothetical protein
MAGRTIHKVILGLLIAGAVIFVLLLAGVGSDALTNAKSYLPSAP